MSRPPRPRLSLLHLSALSSIMSSGVLAGRRIHLEKEPPHVGLHTLQALVQSCRDPGTSALQPLRPKGLSIYFIDTEGGAAATLRIVRPRASRVLHTTAAIPGRPDASAFTRPPRGGLIAIDNLLINGNWQRRHTVASAHLSSSCPFRSFTIRGIPEKLDERSQESHSDPGLQKRPVAAVDTLKAGDQVPLKQAEGSLPVPC